MNGRVPRGELTGLRAQNQEQATYPHPPPRIRPVADGAARGQVLVVSVIR
jgi:hypothetical protein